MSLLPRPTAETLPFWEGCASGALRYQACVACDHAQFPPRRHCLRCGTDELVWKPAAGRGVVHSFTVVHRAPLPVFKAQVPYVIALIDLAEGFRMMMNIRGTTDIRIGQPVTVFFERLNDTIALPQARLEE